MGCCLLISKVVYTTGPCYALVNQNTIKLIVLSIILLVFYNELSEVGGGRGRMVPAVVYD